MTRMTKLPGIRFASASAAIIAFALSAARADVTYTEMVEPDGRTNLTVIRMTVTPAAEPVPALRHRLVASDIDLKPGNAALSYYRAMLELRRTTDVVRKRYGDEKLSNWYGTGADTTPIDELPIAEIREAAKIWAGDYILNQLNEASLRTNCEWQSGIEEIRGPELIATPLPEYQFSREIYRMLALRTRMAIAERRYDDAINWMRLTYATGRNVAAEPMLVSGLVGLAGVSMANGQLIELIAAPDSPNMYWALAELPDPLVDLRRAMRFEMSNGPRIFPFMHNAETTSRSPGEWNQVFKQSVRQIASVAGNTSNVRMLQSELGAVALALIGYPHAKARLVEMGMDRERVERMAVGQVLAIYSERSYLRIADEYEKLWYLPFQDMLKQEQELDRQVDQARPFTADEDREILPIVTLLLPATQAARAAQVRVERDIAALRVIEALRMYAAGHDGRLPAQLAHVTEVPIPLNPATSQPFVYRLDGNTGVLELPSSDGIRIYNRRFEITIRRQ